MPRRFKTLSQAARYYAYRVLRRGFGVSVSHVFVYDLARVLLIADDRSGLTYRFLTPEDVWVYAGDPENDLDVSMVDRLAAGNDLCFAALDGSTLANYSWYALEGIEAEHAMGLPVAFADDTAYLYKSFTCPAYRGRGLNFTGVAHALHALGERGMRRVIGIVEYANWPSLASYGRFHAKRLGLLVSVGGDKALWAHYPKGAAAEGIEFGKLAAVRQTNPHDAMTAVGV